MPDRDTPTAVFRFTKADDFRILAVNCVWGGRTIRGDIMVNLCHENYALPETVTHARGPKGEILQEIGREPVHVFDRVVQAAMVLTNDQARSIGAWLVETANHVQPTEEKGADSERRPATAH